MAERRNKLAPEDAQSIGRVVQERLLQSGDWQRAQTVCCYLAAARETPTGRLVADCHAAGRRLCVPAYCARRRMYCPAWLMPGAEMRSGWGGIPEPARPQWADDARVELTVVPGVAFDQSGTRLGHGQGHYDRMLQLPALHRSFKIGLAFDFQLLPRLPADAWDIRMDAVITEKGVVRISGHASYEENQATQAQSNLSAPAAMPPAHGQ